MPENVTNSLALSVDHEHEQWSDLFNRELRRKGKALYSSYWWRSYYTEIKHALGPTINATRQVKILEAGSGSGKCSIILGKTIDRTLLDISADALDYAELLAKKFQAVNIKYVEADIFNMPFKARSFSHVWNIGVLEHYMSKDAKKLVESMVRVTRKNGYVAIGVPNFRSPPIVKAKLLQRRLFKLVPGYRLDSELSYSATDIQRLVKSSCKALGRKVTEVQVHHAGVPLFVESPRIVVKTLGKITERMMPHRKFLTLVICKVD